MSAIIDFVIGIAGRIVSGLMTTYIVRLVDFIKDRFQHKNNRHGQ